MRRSIQSATEPKSERARARARVPARASTANVCGAAHLKAKSQVRSWSWLLRSHNTCTDTHAHTHTRDTCVGVLWGGDDVTDTWACDVIVALERHERQHASEYRDITAEPELFGQSDVVTVWRAIDVTDDDGIV